MPGIVGIQKEEAVALTFKGFLDMVTEVGRDTGDAQKLRGHCRRKNYQGLHGEPPFRGEVATEMDFEK